VAENYQYLLLVVVVVVVVVGGEGLGGELVGLKLVYCTNHGSYYPVRSNWQCGFQFKKDLSSRASI